MPLLLLGGLATLLGGAFLGSQIDDAIDKPTTVVGGGTKQPMPIEYRFIVAVGGATAVYFLVKKYVKKF